MSSHKNLSADHTQFLAAELAAPRPSSRVSSLRAVGYDFGTALADIVDNSITAGATRINIRVSWGDGSPRVSITDNGAGMSPTGKDQVFEPFYTTKSHGSGLGMSIVYRTLKENDASIGVDSTEGKGTTFTMFFKAGSETSCPEF